MKIFKIEEEMLEYLRKDVVGKQELTNCYVDEIHLKDLPDAPIMSASLSAEYEVAEDTMKDCMRSHVLTALPYHGDMRVFPTYPTALSSLSDRAKLSGTTIKDHPIVLNEGFVYYKENCQPLYQDNVLLAVHSNEYAYLPQDRLMEETIIGISDLFTVSEFVGGSYEPELTTAQWRFPKNGFTRLGMQAIPALLFTTNDVGKCGANLHAMMEINTRVGGMIVKNMCRMGSTLSCTHKDGHTIDSFKRNVEQTFSLLRDSEEKILKLKEIAIKHPEECFMNLVRKQNLPVNAGEKALDDFTTFRGASVTAFDIYTYLWNIKIYLQSDGVVPAKICDVEENIARLVSLTPAGWSRMDVIR